MSYHDEDEQESLPKKTYTFPANMAVCADMYFKLKEKRKAMERKAAEVKEEENALAEHIINKLPASKATGIAGKLVRIAIEKKEIPVVKDWPKFYAFILKTKSFEFLNRAPNAKAIKERWNDGKTVPGTDKFIRKVIAVNKLKKGK